MLNEFLSSLTTVINAYFRCGESNQIESARRLQNLKGHVITITLLPLHFTFQMTFSEQGIQLYPQELLAAETKITGTPLQLGRIMMTKEAKHHFFTDDLTIEGNAELGQQVISLFDAVNIDWEEYLSHLIGDVPAYHAGQFVRDINKWLHRLDDSFSHQVNEYVHEEAAWLPSREALHDFFMDIDTLRMDADRIEARIKQLTATIMKHEEQQ